MAKLTFPEIEAALIEGGLTQAEVAQLALNADYLINGVALAADQMSATLYSQYTAALTGDVIQEVLDKARDLANKNAAESAVGIATSDLKAMGKTISQGLDAGLNPLQIAKNLDQVKGLTQQGAATHQKFLNYLDNLDPAISAEDWERRAQGNFDKLLRKRRETIAITEARDATSEGQLQLAKARDARFKVWHTTGDSRVSDECQANEASGVLPIGKAFPSGEMRTPAHPSCRCSIAYLSDERVVRLEQNDVADRVANTKAAIAEGKEQAKAKKAKAPAKAKAPVKAKAAATVKDDAKPKTTEKVKAPALSPVKKVSPEVTRNAKSYEDTVRGEKKENARAWGPDGNQVLDKAGAKHSVGFTQKEIDAMRGGVATHNHPNLGSLSFDDITFAKTADLAEIRAIDPKYRYKVTPPKGGWGEVDMDAVKKRRRNISTGIIKRDVAEVKRRVREHIEQLDFAELNATVTHVANEKIAEEFGFGYTRELI